MQRATPLHIIAFLLAITATSESQQRHHRCGRVAGDIADSSLQLVYAPSDGRRFTTTTSGDGCVYGVADIPELTPRVNRPMHATPLLVDAKFVAAVPADQWLWVPQGWGVKIFHAGGLDKPRFLAWGPDSVLHVANLNSGRVLALPDRHRDGIADTSILAADNVEAHDIKFFRGAMYAAEESRILKLVDADRDGYYETRSTFIDSLPTGGHTTRTIIFDTLRNVVYVSVGSASNASRDSVQAVVYEFQLDGSGRRIFASGVRNAVGMSQHPVTGQLWATNNGQDWQGDDIPPEWISIVRDGGFYGYPIAHSDQQYFDFQINDQYRGLLPIAAADSARVRTMIPPSATVTAHSAPMAIEFANAGMPDGYRNGAFVALHGSWNRTVPTGNTIVYLDFDGPTDTVANTMSYVMSADSSEAMSRIWWMRPCGLESDTRGNIYFTSDRNEMPLIGVLYPVPMIAPVEQLNNVDVSRGSLRIVPNPAASSTSITFTLSEGNNCLLELFDALGTLVIRIADTWHDAGAHHVELETRALASGTYRLRLTSGSRVEQRNFVVQH